LTVKRQIARLPGARTARHLLNLERPTRPEPKDYHKPILGIPEGGDEVYALLSQGRGALAARIGGMELECLMQFLNHRSRARKRPYPESIRYCMATNTGFFPTSDGSLDAFARHYLDAISQVDVMGVWFNIGEDRVVQEFCPRATLVPLRSIEPYYCERPWSRALRGRNVLVIHPFADSIQEQYEHKRQLLFDNEGILPPFDLHLIRAVQSAAGEAPDFDSWFAALESMKASMDAMPYDVCIVGAGSYGLPLAAHAKASGRLAVHMGGATQILFGIKGHRWDDHEIISTLYRDSWVRPKPSEVPREFTLVEDGCYW
jgi:hypothetical protein